MTLLQEFKDKIYKRPNSSDHLLVEVLFGLLERYFERVPDAKRIFEITKQRGDWIKNDHIAFRSQDMTSLLKVFLPYDYTVQFLDNETRTPFNFTSKKLTAVWLKHPNPDMPRVFISEFRLDEAPELSTIVEPYFSKKVDPIDNLDPNDTDAVVNYLHTGCWPTPTFTDYNAVQEHSEYLSWVLYNEYYLNHFTLTVNVLNSFNFNQEIETLVQSKRREYATIAEEDQDTFITELETKLSQTYKSHMQTFNNFLEEQGFTLNSPNGNALNISPDGALLQSSTKAAMIKGKFPDGTYDVPGSYVEFAYRGIEPTFLKAIMDGEISYNTVILRDGFETGNADKIFESTFTNTSEQNATKNKSTFEASTERLITFLDDYSHNV